MLKFIVGYAGFEVAVIGVALLFTLWHAYRRRRGNKFIAKPGFVPTDEVFVDPTTDNQQRVWYNPTTGEREYESLK